MCKLALVEVYLWLVVEGGLQHWQRRRRREGWWSHQGVPTRGPRRSMSAHWTCVLHVYISTENIPLPLVLRQNPSAAHSTYDGEMAHVHVTFHFVFLFHSFPGRYQTGWSRRGRGGWLGTARWTGRPWGTVSSPATHTPRTGWRWATSRAHLRRGDHIWMHTVESIPVKHTSWYTYV